MSTTKEYISVTDTAKLLRASLKKNFPHVKFSVRSNSYSGGASIDVGWVNGPTVSAVDKVAKLYAGADFDGMTDSINYHTDIMVDANGEAKQVHFGANFVFTGREVDEKYRQAVCAAVCATFADYKDIEPKLDGYGGFPNEPFIPGLGVQSWFWPVLGALDLDTMKIGECLTLRKGDGVLEMLQEKFDLALKA